MKSTCNKKQLITSKFEIIDGQFIHIDGYVHFCTDNAYGADADGNRGWTQTFVDDVTNLQAYDDNGNDIELLPDQKQVAEDKLVRKFLEN